MEGSGFYPTSLIGWLWLREQSRAATPHWARKLSERLPGRPSTPSVKSGQRPGTPTGRPAPWESERLQIPP